MTKEEFIQTQKLERKKILQSILDSKKTKKIIVAGAGTGKTYTFSEVLKQNPEGTNIAMTFIRLLRNDMSGSLSSYAEVRTFHEFCIKILHKNRGDFSIYPKLTSIIHEDAIYLNADCDNFDEKFQKLDESGNEINFYLKRGDYYNTLAFNDSVYRMLREIQRDPDMLSSFDQILIDEFQDFNPLEVAFIDELEKKGNILIVGDDDQAVYETRFSTPNYLRIKYKSGQYEIFELPFCSRCTKTIVNATNNIIKQAQEYGALQDRIQKRYECFIELKDADNKKYPKITTAHLTNLHTVIKFIKQKIVEISEEEINESWEEGKEYPTILIVGSRQYLNSIYKNLRKDYENITFKQTEKNEVSICDGYSFLIQNINSNLGWRILIDFLIENNEIKKIIEKTNEGKTIIDLLPKEIIEHQKKIISIITMFNDENEDNDLLLIELEKLVDNNLFIEIKEKFIKLKEQETVINKKQPSVLLTSFQGCKGMSAGFVFIVGANNGIIPKDTSGVSDVEICQFIVALTRTRKKCYILSEDRMYGPKDDKGNWIPKNERSIFIDLILESDLEDLGNLNASQIK